MMRDLASMDRRTLLERAALLIGASALASGCSGGGGGFVFEGFTDSQKSTLAALAETILPRTETPGAIDVGVPMRLERMLELWGAPDTAKDFIRVLGEVDALPSDGRAFANLDAEERHALLRVHDEAAMQPSGEEQGARFPAPGPGVVDRGYGRLKDLIVTLYFMSEEPLQDQVPYVHSPGRWDPSVPVTDELRHSAELSYFS